MKASVIIPCHPRNRQILSRTLDSIERAAAGLEVERLVIHDEDAKGPSWARNRGLDRAQGDFVFFVDADDEVEPEFFRRPVAKLEESGADLCFFSYNGGPRLVEGVIDGNDAVRSRYLPSFFGYSIEDVRRWYAGGSLAAHKEMGQVWRAAYRRDFLERNGIRFDERITLFEDAAFLSECCALAGRTASLADALYRYRPLASGNLATGWRHERNWEYKFLIRDFRERLDAKCGGTVWKYCEASAVFSALELLKARHRWREYIADERVKAALKAFPLSPRHPVVAAAVIFLRCAA